MVLVFDQMFIYLTDTRTIKRLDKMYQKHFYIIGLGKYKRQQKLLKT